MGKFTPGPWSVEDPMGADVGLWIVQSGLQPAQWSCIAIVTDDEDGAARDEGGRFIGRTEQSANATLIAAAPELVEALKEARVALVYAERGSDAEDGAKYLATLSKIDAALSKAGVS